MAKSGIKYYNIDTDRYSDRRIRELILHCGLQGLAIYDCILCEIYREEGYFVKNDSALVLCAIQNLLMDSSKIGVIKNCVNICCKVGLFSDELRVSWEILTSRSIQLRYMKIKAGLKHKVERIPDNILLVDVADMPPIFAQLYASSEKLPQSSEFLPQSSEFLNENSAIKENKRKEIKEKEKEKEKSVCVSAHTRVTPTAVNTHTYFLFEIERAFFLRGFMQPERIAKSMIDYYTGEGKDLQELPKRQAIAKVTNWNPKAKDDYKQTNEDVAQLFVKLVDRMQISTESKRKMLNCYNGISWNGNHLIFKFSDTFIASCFTTYNKDYSEILAEHFGGQMKFIEAE